MDNATVLRYWAEPEYVYYVKDITWWKEDRDVLSCEKKSVGYIPIYETREDAEQAHPMCEVFELTVIPVDEH